MAVGTHLSEDVKNETVERLDRDGRYARESEAWDDNDTHRRENV